MFYIYEIVNLLNQKRYVGYTREEPAIKRWRRHIRTAKKPKTHIHNAIHKYGEKNFSFNILEVGENNIYGLKVAEPLYIEWLKPEYNLTKGGQGPNGYRGFKHSNEFKAKQAIRMKGKRHSLGYKHNDVFRNRCHIRMLGNHFALGKKLSDKVKKQLSLRTKGNKYNVGKGIPHTVEWKKQMSERLKGKPQPTVSCPICMKVGSISNMKRWHFTNCKMSIKGVL